MTELNEAHFELHSANKDKLYQKRKLVEEQLKNLLDRFSSDDLIDMIMKIKEEN